MAYKTTAASLVFMLGCAALPALAQETPAVPAVSQTTVTQTVTTTAAPEVIPGAFQPERALLLQKIMRAKQQGTGIAGYLSAFNSLQEMVKTGQPDAQVKQRIDSVSKAVDEQLERSKILKTQRVPPAAFSGGAAAPGPSGGKGGNSSIDDLMQKYGKNLGPDVNKAALMKRIGEGAGGGGMPDELIKKLGDKKDLLNDPRAREILEKLKAN